MNISDEEVRAAAIFGVCSKLPITRNDARMRLAELADWDGPPELEQCRACKGAGFPSLAVFDLCRTCEGTGAEL